MEGGTTVKKTCKYIILLVLDFIGIYNLIEFFGQSSMMPLYFVIESFCLFGVLVPHNKEAKCQKS